MIDVSNRGLPKLYPKLYLDEKALLFLSSSHPKRHGLIAILEDWLKEEREIITSTFALQSLQQLLHQQKVALSKLRYLWDVIDGLFHNILPLEWAILKSALAIQEEQNIPYTKALHLALIRANGISHIIAGYKLLPVEEATSQI